MKKCPYCGKEYPDEATVCLLDGEALSGERKKVTGVWRAVYGYGLREKLPGHVPAAFTLKLKQGWTSHFTGSVTEDAPPGTPGTGTIDGYFSVRPSSSPSRCRWARSSRKLARGSLCANT